MIAIIALLIGILLPSLGAARESGRKVGCLSNVRQLGVATVAYAGDHRDRIWEVNGWLRRNEAGEPEPFGTKKGAVFEYLGESGEVLGCPKNRRTSADGSNQTKLGLPGAQTLDTDYAIVGNCGGASLASEVRTAYDPKPVPLPGPEFVGVGGSSTRVMKVMPGAGASLPVFVEEHELWENTLTHDARFLGDLDQLSQRHGGESNLSMMDGTAMSFRPPAGPNPNLREDTDFVTTRFYFLGTSSSAGGAEGWVQNPLTRQEYGWINRVQR